jgi:hypothetical protein
MVLDSTTGDLYVCDRRCLRKVEPTTGTVTTPLAWVPEPSIYQETSSWDAHLGKDTLRKYERREGGPQSLAVHGRRLFFVVDWGENVLTFDLDQQRAASFVSMRPDPGPCRFGALKMFAPGVPEDRCAALPRPKNTVSVQAPLRGV